MSKIQEQQGVDASAPESASNAVYIEEEMTALTDRLPVKSASDVHFGVRAFRGIESSRVFYGILLCELADSFVIALPATFGSDGETVMVSETTSATVIRRMRSSIISIALPETDLNFYYLMHVEANKDRLPEFWEGERAEKIQEFLNEDRDDSEIVKKYTAGQVQPSSSSRASQDDDDDEYSGLEFQGVTYKTDKIRH